MSRRMIGEHDAAPSAAKDSEVRRRGRTQTRASQRPTATATCRTAVVAEVDCLLFSMASHTGFHALEPTLRKLAVLRWVYVIARLPHGKYAFCRKRPVVLHSRLV